MEAFLRSRYVMTDSVGATKGTITGEKSSLWPLLPPPVGLLGWERASLVGRAAWGWVCFEKCGDFRRQMLPIRSHGLAATGCGALGMLSKCCLSTVPSAQIPSLSYLPACSSGATAGADAGISVEALILFILRPKLGHQCCQEARFFGLIHRECIFNAVSAVLQHRTPTWCMTAGRALQ